MVALIPVAIIGIVLLIAIGKIRLPKSQDEKNRDEEVDKKGFAGVVIDDATGEGASQALKEDLTEKGVAGVLLDGVVGDGAYKKLTREIDEVEATREAAVDGFLDYIDQAERGRQEFVRIAGQGIAEFGASLHQSAQDAYQGAVGFFGGLVPVPTSGRGA